MHTIVISAKKNCWTQWQVVICGVNVYGVRSYLAKTQGGIRRDKERFEEKSEGGNCTVQSQDGYLSRIVYRVSSILDTRIQR